MTVRRALLDDSGGERRGVVLLDGRPEHLLIERDDEPARARLGERRVVRIRSVVAGFASAFVDLGDGLDGRLKLGGKAPRLAEGALAEAEVVAEARAGKTAALRLVGQGTGEPGLRRTAPTLEEDLTRLSGGATVERGDAARAAGDTAQDQALAPRHALGKGLSLSVEPTRALVAVDLDLTEPARTPGEANRRALVEVARLLRLKSLAGRIYIDLIGSGVSSGLSSEAEAVFGVRVTPIQSAGAMTFVWPHGRTPVGERLLEAGGGLGPHARAAAVVREMERAGRAEPGTRVTADVAPELLDLVSSRIARLGPRFTVAPRLATPVHPPDMVWA